MNRTIKILSICTRKADN